MYHKACLNVFWGNESYFYIDIYKFVSVRNMLSSFRDSFYKEVQRTDRVLPHGATTITLNSKPAQPISTWPPEDKESHCFCCHPGRCHQSKY